MTIAQLFHNLGTLLHSPPEQLFGRPALQLYTGPNCRRTASYIQTTNLPSPVVQCLTVQS